MAINEIEQASAIDRLQESALAYANVLRSPRLILQYLRELPPTMVIGGFISLAYIAVALTAPWWIPYSHTAVGVSTPFDTMSGQHWFGTDSVGRDVFSRAMFATRLELTIAVLGTGARIPRGHSDRALGGTRRGHL